MRYRPLRTSPRCKPRKTNHAGQALDKYGLLRLDAIAAILTAKGLPTTKDSVRALHSRALRKMREAFAKAGII